MCQPLPLKIVADSAIPFLKGVFEPFAEVVYIPGESIRREDLTDAQALLTRTRTRCDASLLEGTAVQIIASATIGLDHVDLPWCDAHGIVVRNAAGCNAGGVMGYVFSALFAAASRRSISIMGKTMGIVGVGHVGRRVLHLAKHIGFNVLLCDPPRAAAEGDFGFVSIEHLLKQSDIVTLHVPLDDTTRGMCDDAWFKLMKPGAFFINASRGEVVVDSALKKAIPKLGPVIIDTWNNEPDIDRELLDKVDIATPHIAGYSYQGKQNGTAAVVRALAHFFKIPSLYEFFPQGVEGNEAVKLDLRGMDQGHITSTLQYNYPVLADDFMFRLDPSHFEQLRREYKYRREIFVDL